MLQVLSSLECVRLQSFCSECILFYYVLPPVIFQVLIHWDVIHSSQSPVNVFDYVLPTDIFQVLTSLGCGTYHQFSSEYIWL
jgi:hypothetical protein